MIVGCAVDCSKNNGSYCDPNTGNCEPCIDICLPSRGTQEECRDQILCKDFWNMSASTVLDRDAPTTSAAEAAAVASSDLLLNVLTSVLVFICFLVVASLIVFIVRRKRRRQARERHRAGSDVTYKPPIPVSAEEQDRERLCAAEAHIENGACVDNPPQAHERRAQPNAAKCSFKNELRNSNPLPAEQGTEDRRLCW